MRGNALLEALVTAAKGRGLVVRREALTRGVTQGGLCVVKGAPTVFLDDRAVIDAQIEVLAAVLRRYEWSDEEKAALPDAVKSVLSRAAKTRAAN